MKDQKRDRKDKTDKTHGGKTLLAILAIPEKFPINRAPTCPIHQSQEGPAWFGPAPGPCAIAAPGPSTTSVTDGGQRSPSWSRRSAATSTRPKSPRAHGHAADGSKVGCPFGSLGHWRHGFKKLRWSPERQMGCCLVFMATKFCKEFEDEKLFGSSAVSFGWETCAGMAPSHDDSRPRSRRYHSSVKRRITFSSDNELLQCFVGIW
jgi:hypothetical protein